ncbi:hypothetical protein BOX15_Mlig017304g1 [Macrostomum lignano]|uniref:F-box domain-containing protein n=1 Tax=Macrostomum lignano TaxID=282301 RepID=A0A267F750_9PLAT|nr:hypothetical protein BOX15_Mlig017304g1 [Macrostomum lignano]
MPQQQSDDEKPKDSALRPSSDPCSPRCLPQELCERILRLLDVRSLLACRGVSHRWRASVSASGAWRLHAARLGLPAEPAASLAQRVALLSGACGRVAAVRLDVSNEEAAAEGGMAWAEKLLSAHYSNGQLRLLLYTPELNRARVCRIRVVLVSGADPPPRPVSLRLGRHGLLLRTDWLGSGSLLLPLLGLTRGATWPMFELDDSVTSLLAYPCACGHRRLVCAAESRLQLWSLPPLASPAAEVPSARLRPQAELQFDSTVEGLAYLDPPDGNCLGEQLAVAISPSAATLVRIGCQRLERLHRLTALSDACLNIRSLPSCFNTVEELLDDAGKFSGYFRVTRYWQSAPGAVSGSDCHYGPLRHRLSRLLQLLDLQSHFLLLFSAGQLACQQVAALFRYGAERPLLQLIVPAVSRPASGCGLLRTAVVREPVPWCHGLDPRWPCLPLYLSFTPGVEFELLQWRLGLQEAGAADRLVKAEAAALCESGGDSRADAFNGV